MRSCAQTGRTRSCGGSSSSRTRLPVPEHEHDEILGRAYDRRLVRRLWDTARPQRLLIAGTVALFPLVAAVELAQPYLVKIAIDDYVLRGDWAGLRGVVGLF